VTDFGLRTEYRSNISNYPKALQYLAPPDFVWLQSFEIHPPVTARLTVHFLTSRPIAAPSVTGDC
jgi:hypothetical protein